MRTRDVVFITVALWTAYIALRRGGEIELRELFELDVGASSDNGALPDYPNERSCVNLSPVVEDIDGDGLKELILRTKRSKVALFRATPANSPVFLDEFVAHEEGGASARIISIDVTSISGDASSSRIVIITDDLLVTCLDSTLTVRWKKFLGQCGTQKCHGVYVSTSVASSETVSTIVVSSRMAPVGASVDVELNEGKGSTQNQQKDIKATGGLLVCALDISDGTMLWTQSPTETLGTIMNADSAIAAHPQYKMKGIESYHDVHKSHRSWHLFEGSVISMLSSELGSNQEGDINATHLEKQRHGTYGKQKKESKWTKSGRKAVNPMARHAYDKLQLNAVSVHRHYGIEYLSLKDGSPLCFLPLPRGYKSIGFPLKNQIRHYSMHKEEAATITDTAPIDNKKSIWHLQCMTGLPPSEIVFRTFIEPLPTTKKRRSMTQKNSLDGNNATSVEHSNLLFLPHFSMDSSLTASGYDVVVSFSSGVVYSFDSVRGTVNWRVKLRPLWNPGGGSGFLSSMHLKTPVGVERAVAVSGEASISILSATDGRIVGTARIFEPPVCPFLIADVDNDGRDDIVLVGVDHAIAYGIQRSLGSHSWILFVCLLVILVTVLTAYVQRSNDQRHDVKVKRSTD